MGYLSALGMVEQSGDDERMRAIALAWHLSNNHYPPVSHAWVPACERAMSAYIDGRYSDLIECPPGYSRAYIPASEIVSGLHLEPFISGYLVEPDDEY